jgi:hypothetical protein
MEITLDIFPPAESGTSSPLKLIFIHKYQISFLKKFVEKPMGSFVVANPRRLGVCFNSG